jgi:glycosyltransferase involved in cell wall biosynthesis
MSSTPLVSIGLFVYNGERFLQESLNSILNQTLTDFEG